MKPPPVASLSMSAKAKAESVSQFRSELSVESLKRSSQPINSNERASLSSLLSDPAALTQVVRHAGLSAALNEALLAEGSNHEYSKIGMQASLSTGLNKVLEQTKPTSYDTRGLYAATLEPSRTTPHHNLSSGTDASPIIDRHNLDYEIAMRYAPTAWDINNTIDYITTAERHVPLEPDFKIYRHVKSTGRVISFASGLICIAIFFLICFTPFIIARFL